MYSEHFSFSLALSYLNRSDAGMRKILWCITAVLLLGCQSLPPNGKVAMASVRKDKAIVYVFDAVGGIKLGGETLVVNGTEAGPVDRREYTWFYASPGTLDISFNDPTFHSMRLAARRLTVEPGHVYYIKYHIYDQGSDALIFAQNLSSDKSKGVDFRANDLPSLSEQEAQDFLHRYHLVGNKLQ